MTDKKSSLAQRFFEMEFGLSLAEMPSKVEVTPTLQVLSYIAQLSAIGERPYRKTIRKDLGISGHDINNALTSLENYKLVRYRWGVFERGKLLSKIYRPSRAGEEVLKKCEMPPYG
jgi:hypothetical protein